MHIRTYVRTYVQESLQNVNKHEEGGVQSTYYCCKNIQGYQCACHNLYHLMGVYVRIYIYVYICSSC